MQLGKSPEDRGDLPDDLRVNPIPQFLRSKPPAGIGADDEIALVERTTTAQVAAVPHEKKTQRRFAGGLGLRGILDAAVDDNERGVDEQRMDRGFIPSHPKYIRKRKAPEVGIFIE